MKTTFFACTPKRFPSLLLLSVTAISFLLAYVVSTSYSSLPWRFIDEIFSNFLFTFRSELVTSVMKVLSLWGKWGLVSSWLLIISGFLIKKKWRYALWSLWISAGGWALAEGLKILIDRPRPSLHLLATEFSQSFPSSHSLTSIIFCLSLSYICIRYSRKFFLSFVLFACVFILAVAVGMSRLYLGVHYFSDVLSGYLLGIGFFSFSLWFFKKTN
jgi:membrane-associated phospholipid phosphatase